MTIPGSPQGNNRRFPGYRELKVGEEIKSGDMVCGIKDDKSGLRPSLAIGNILNENDIGEYFRHTTDSESAPLAAALSRIEVLEGVLRDIRETVQGEAEIDQCANMVLCMVDQALSIPPESTGGENAG